MAGTFLDKGCCVGPLNPSACEEKRESQVDRELVRQINEINRTWEAVNTLEARLSSVLAGDTASGEDLKEPEPYRVPLASAIGNRTLEISGIATKVEEMVRQLEL
jgi:hypothetical protein